LTVLMVRSGGQVSNPHVGAERQECRSTASAEQPLKGEAQERSRSETRPARSGWWQSVERVVKPCGRNQSGQVKPRLSESARPQALQGRKPLGSRRRLKGSWQVTVIKNVGGSFNRKKVRRTNSFGRRGFRRKPHGC